MESLTALRALFCADVAEPPPFGAWDRSAWEQLVATASRLEAESMLYSSLKRGRFLDRMDVDLKDRLQRAYAATSAKNLALMHEARRVLAALETAGVRAAPLKGVALFLNEAIRDPGARPMADIDIVTDRRQRTDVMRVLEGLGYEQRGKPNPPKHLAAFRRDDFWVEVHEQAYWSTHDGSPVGVDEMVDARGNARLDRTFVHLLHHLFEGSVPVPSLIVKTLWDANEIRVCAEGARDLLPAIVGLARSAALARELGSLELALAKVLGRPAPDGLDASDAEVAALLRACDPVDAEHVRSMHLRYYLRLLRNQPLGQKAAILWNLLRSGGTPAQPLRRRVGARAIRSLRLAGRLLGEVGRLVGVRRPRD